MANIFSRPGHNPCRFSRATKGPDSGKSCRSSTAAIQRSFCGKDRPYPVPCRWKGSHKIATADGRAKHRIGRIRGCNGEDASSGWISALKPSLTEEASLRDERAKNLSSGTIKAEGQSRVAARQQQRNRIPSGTRGGSKDTEIVALKEERDEVETR